MKAITTKYHGPTNFKGSRISASDEDGNKIFVHYDCSLNSDDNHKQAAIKLCDKMNWSGRLMSGHVKTGYVFVFVDDRDIFTVGNKKKVYSLNINDTVSGIGQNEDK